MWNQLQDRTPHLFSCLSMCHHPSQYFFEAPPKRVSLTHHSSNLIIHFFINDLLLSMFIQARHTEGRIWAKNSLFVYTLWWCLWWLFQALSLFSYSFDGVYSTFLQVLTATSCSFIISFVTPRQVTKVFSSPVYTSKNPSSSSSSSSSSSLNLLHCRFSASMNFYSSTYTWGWQFLLCRQNRSLTMSLDCNTCRMEHFGHENLSLWVLSTFLTYNGVLVFSLYQFCCQFFKQLWLNLIPNLFILKHPLRCLKSIKWHCIGRVFVVLWHAIAKYIFRLLDKQWHQCPIKMIAYNITAVLTIISWHLIRNHHLVYIDWKYISYLSLPIEVFSCNIFINTFLISAYQIVKKNYFHNFSVLFFLVFWHAPIPPS